MSTRATSELERSTNDNVGPGLLRCDTHAGVEGAEMKTILSGFLRRTSASLLAAGLVVLSGGCAFHGAVYSSGPPGPYYDYYFYPDWDVYYYPHGHIYYWNDGGHWRSAGRLPPRYELHEEHREQLRLHTRKPWTEHHQERSRQHPEQPGHDHH
jgi:hypothetical protein